MQHAASPYFVREILVASGNENKIRELQTAASAYDLVLHGPRETAEARGLPPPPHVPEEAETYLENAMAKAQAFAAWAGMPALGDDSGLEVLALGRKPGVHSARYAGHGASDGEKIAKLLCEFNTVRQDKPAADRTAYFCCTLVLAYPNGALLTAEGTLKGEVLDVPRGSGGFGYDPIILIEDLGRTLAEVDFATTCDKGFRAKAARSLFEQLSKLKVDTSQTALRAAAERAKLG